MEDILDNLDYNNPIRLENGIYFQSENASNINNNLTKYINEYNELSDLPFNNHLKITKIGFIKNLGLVQIISDDKAYKVDEKYWKDFELIHSMIVNKQSRIHKKILPISVFIDQNFKFIKTLRKRVFVR